MPPKRAPTILTPRFNWSHREGDKRADVMRIFIDQDKTAGAVKRYFVEIWGMDPNTPIHAIEHQIARWGIRKRGQPSKAVDPSNPTPPPTPQWDVASPGWLTSPDVFVQGRTPGPLSPPAAFPPPQRSQTVAPRNMNRTPPFVDRGTAHPGWPRNWYVPPDYGPPRVPTLGLTGESGCRPPPAGSRDPNDKQDPPSSPSVREARQPASQYGGFTRSNGAQHSPQYDPYFPNGRPRGFFS